MKRAQYWIGIFWPSFVVAGIAEIVFFTLFDPVEMVLFGTSLDIPRIGIYTFGFFGFWGVGILSSGLTLFLQSSDQQ